MAKVRLFISYDYDNDAFLTEALVEQSKKTDSPFEFTDASVKVHLTGDWEEKVRGRIDRADQVAVICGKNTTTATGVTAEIEIAQALGKPYFLLAGYSSGGNKKPKSALASDKMYEWTWPNLKSLISGNR
ncbi:unannotated protein [freshwater metagenome]|uniref:Unannotated protein n=1 Tax=freshwater metagenome TaxID=449393 RepID=A0A6J7G8B5_9ZZZZ|nr:hypothetical protein [Actinomycetota bacterium]